MRRMASTSSWVICASLTCLPVAAVRALARSALVTEAAPAQMDLADPTFTQCLPWDCRSEEHTSELQSQSNLVCRLLLEKKKNRHQDLRALRRTSRSPEIRPRSAQVLP